MKIAVIISQFNKKISDRLLKGAKRALRKNKINHEIFEVPGAFEIPFMAAKLADSKKFSGLIALGCVIKGETDHYRAVCDSVTYGTQKVAIENRVPIMFGVLMCENSEQALLRSSLTNMKNNKGYECAKGLIELLKNFSVFFNVSIIEC